MMAGILILTFLVPVIIRAASRAFINRFAPAAAQEQTEADEDRYRVMEGYAETEDDVRLLQYVNIALDGLGIETHQLTDLVIADLRTYLES